MHLEDEGMHWGCLRGVGGGMIAMGMFRHCVVCAPIFSMHRWHPLWFACTAHLEDRGIELAVGALGVAPGAGGALRGGGRLGGGGLGCTHAHTLPKG